MRFLSSIKDLKGKTALLRADLDAPHENGKILDDFRIKSSVPTIKDLLAKGAGIIIVSKTGKPKGSPESADSLQEQGRILAGMLGCEFVKADGQSIDPSISGKKRLIFFGQSILDSATQAQVKKASASDIVILENIRFYREEIDADPAFAKMLASLADVYVNDAFAMMHRNEASVSVVENFLPSYAGLNVEKEISGLNKLLTLNAQPFLVIIGGAKISDKVGTIKNLGKQAANILVGGGPANLFLLAKGYEIGDSLCERDQINVAQDLMRNFKDKIILPVDMVVADKNDHAKLRVSSPDQISKNEQILDIGPQTILLFSKYIKAAKKMVWNGPMGLFEEKSFSHGTMSIASIYAARCKGFAYGVVGGGDTLEAINKAKVADQIDFVSTAGSATLDYLAGEQLPGLIALERSKI
ncbi:phosphoglycerate kinase [Patescibacteria group bacterium]|nr:phosphoglycerate kinase [Patescibacteria group bacterium]